MSKLLGILLATAVFMAVPTLFCVSGLESVAHAAPTALSH